MNGFSSPLITLKIEYGADETAGFANAYWRTDGPEMWLSDSIATLNATSNTPPTLAEEHLSEYLSFRYNHAPRTLYKNRYALIAGHFTIFKVRSDSGRTMVQAKLVHVGTKNSI